MHAYLTEWSESDLRLAGLLLATGVLIAYPATLARAGKGTDGPGPHIQFTCVDDEAIGYATFQSHNQKIVSNRYGIFMTHLRTRNDAYTAQAWRLSRSMDGGQSFVTLYEATHATNPPVLECDADGNLYLMRVDFQDGNAYLYRFRADREFRDPLVTTIPHGSAGKYAMYLDRERRKIYFFAHNNTFHILTLGGKLLQSRTLLRAGPHAVLQYPLLSPGRDGVLHAAWTTQQNGKYMYWDIHHIVSPDGGQSWRNLDGTLLKCPVIADDTGGALRISADDEFDSHTWLSSFLVKNGKLHFLYLAQTDPPRQHYIRYDAVTGRRDLDYSPEFRGQHIALRGLDGFFASGPVRDKSPLYCLGNDHGHVACLVSRDNGATWQDFARSDRAFNVYSLGGCRELDREGRIVGSFTDQVGSNARNDRRSKVYFFSVQTER